jgi:acyl-CoA synthetase (AMP-forming)/AMP-acid ligase II
MDLALSITSGPSHSECLSFSWPRRHATDTGASASWGSGDHYHQDADGYHTYEGRVDDMMKIGGLWVLCRRRHETHIRTDSVPYPNWPATLPTVP